MTSIRRIQHGGPYPRLWQERDEWFGTACRRGIRAPAGRPLALRLMRRIAPAVDLRRAGPLCRRRKFQELDMPIVT